MQMQIWIDGDREASVLKNGNNSAIAEAALQHLEPFTHQSGRTEYYTQFHHQKPCSVT